MNVNIEASWKVQLQTEFDSPYFSALTAFVRDAYRSGVCYPPGKDIFSAFNSCPFEAVKVVIIGQDPYHEPGQAEGLCFSVSEGVQIPPSLQNIYKEIEADLGIKKSGNGSLRHWAEQGVLLLNATLTVAAHKAGSHQGKGWETFTDRVIERLATQRQNIVYLLWGSFAQRKAEKVNPQTNLVLKSAHPSPLSAYRGFFGNHHFSRANAYLTAHGQSPIDW